MKTKLILVIIAIAFLYACKNEQPIETLSNEQRETRLILRVSSLKSKYTENSDQIGKVVNRIRKSEGEGENNNSRTSREEKIRIAKEDMEGFAIGGGVWGAFGGAVGTIINPGIGSAVGLLAGGAAGGIAYAVVWSINAANRPEEGGNGNNGGCEIWRLYSVDTNNPINNFSSELLFDNTIRYANTGWLHNYVLATLYDEDPDIFFNLSTEQIVDGMFSSALSPEIGCENDFWGLYNYIHGRIEYDYESAYADFDICGSDTIFQLYLDGLESIQETQWLSYTEDFMQIVDAELGDYDDQRTLLINGSLSTFMYSRMLWNLNIPKVADGVYIIYDPQYENWELITCNDIYELYNLFLSGGEYKMIFVPKISNGILKSLFIFNDLSMFDYIADIPQINMENEELVIAVSSNISFSLPDGTSIMVPEGTYNGQRFDEGYFIEIDE